MKRNGFTLLEVLIIIVVCAILALIIIPRLAPARDRVKAEAKRVEQRQKAAETWPSEKYFAILEMSTGECHFNTAIATNEQETLKAICGKALENCIVAKANYGVFEPYLQSSCRKCLTKLNTAGKPAAD